MKTQTITPDSLHTPERVYGFSIAEDAGAAAKIELRAGSVSGTIVQYLNLSGAQSGTIVLPKAVFWEFPGGCYVKEVSGSVSGVLYH